MYQRAPKSSDHFPTVQEPVELTFAEHQRAVKRLNRITKISAHALAWASVFGVYGGDVVANQEREQAASIEINVHDINSFDLDGAYTLFIDGYGSNNASYLANKFGESVQQVTEGPVLSANFGDAPIDPRNLAEAVNAAMEKDSEKRGSNEDNPRLVFYGFSAGGIHSVEAATSIITDPENNTTVEMLFMGSTPSGPNSLRDGEIEKIDALNFIADLPGAKYSSGVHFLIAMASDYEQIDLERPQTVTRVVSDNWNSSMNHVEPGVGQLEDQALAIMNADFAQNFKKISEMRGIKQMPVIVYLAAENPNADLTVDNDVASDEICKAAREAGLRCIVLKVPNAVHSVYNTPVESVSETLAMNKTRIQTAVTSERQTLEQLQALDDPLAIASYPPR